MEETQVKYTVMHMNRRLLGVIITVVALVAATSVALLGWKGEVNPTVELGRWDNALEKCFNTIPQEQAAQCITDLSQTAGKAGEIGAGLAILRKGTVRTADMFGKCHDFTHKLGHQAIEQGRENVNAVPDDYSLYSQ